MSIFKTQPHQQYAFQLFPPSTQPATARPIINGSYRQRKGFCIIGSCCLISRRSSEPACPLFHTGSTNLQPRPGCLLLRYSRLCSSRGCFLAFLADGGNITPKICPLEPPRQGWGGMDGGREEGVTQGCLGQWVLGSGRMLSDGGDARLWGQPGCSVPTRMSVLSSPNYKQSQMSQGCQR